MRILGALKGVVLVGCSRNMFGYTNNNAWIISLYNFGLFISSINFSWKIFFTKLMLIFFISFNYYYSLSSDYYLEILYCELRMLIFQEKEFFYCEYHLWILLWISFWDCDKSYYESHYIYYLNTENSIFEGKKNINDILF